MKNVFEEMDEHVEKEKAEAAENKRKGIETHDFILPSCLSGEEKLKIIMEQNLDFIIGKQSPLTGIKGA